VGLVRTVATEARRTRRNEYNNRPRKSVKAGVDCKMRILLDSRDLINVLEQRSPVPIADLDAYLCRGNHQITLCFSNIRELVSPLSDEMSYLEIRPHLQALERLRHTYMKEVRIVAIELQAAVDAFNAGTEYVSPSPYVNRWDQTLGSLPANQRPATDCMVNMSLDNLVFWTYIGWTSPPSGLPTVTWKGSSR
jgi:hypothetical protein